MFSIAHNVYSLCAKRSEQKYTAVVLGVDHAGKTTLINTLKGEISDPESGTATFGRENTLIKRESNTINFIDLGGGKNMRGYWKDVFCEVHAWVYVVDSACPDRFEETRAMLAEAASNELLDKKPLLVLLNKRDLPEAVSEEEVAKALALHELPCPTWQLQKCVALRTSEDVPIDSGIATGLEWLSGAVSRDYSALDNRVEADVVVQKEKEAEEKRKKKEAIKKRKAEREARRKAEEEAAAAEAAAPSEAAAVPQASAAGGAAVAMQEMPMPSSAPSTVEGAVEGAPCPATPDKAQAPAAAIVTPGGAPAAAPGKLEPLPNITNMPSKELPALKGVKPARLEPLQASPGFTDAQAVPSSPLSTPSSKPVPPINGANSIIQDSPIGPSAPISQHPNVPPGSPIE